MKLGLGAKILVWSALIFIVSVLLLAFRTLYPLELKYINLLPADYGTRDTNQLHPSGAIRILQLSSMDHSPAKYYRLVLGVVERLKKEGVRSVIVPVTPQTSLEPEIQHLVRQISHYDNVVFGDELKTFQRDYGLSQRAFVRPDNWWVSQPMLHRVEMFWGVATVRTNPNMTLLRFIPSQYRESMRGYVVPDLALQAIKKLEGYPDAARIVRQSDGYQLGRYRVPTESDGYAYLKPTLFPYRDKPIWAELEPGSDALEFYEIWSGGTKSPVSDSTWKSLGHKIVIIEWSEMNRLDDGSWMAYSGAYAEVINAILTNQFLHRFDEWDLAVIFLLVMIMGTLVFLIRTPFAVILLLAITVLLVFGSMWLFRWHDIIYDPLYGLVAAVLCTVFLPIVKMGHERKFYKRQLELAEERNVRLEEELRGNSSAKAERGSLGS